MSSANRRKSFAIGHKDGNYMNNCVENLECVWTPIEVSEGNCYSDKKRTKKEIQEYLTEVSDKVWLARTRPCENSIVEDARNENVGRILAEYPDIRENGYTEWEYGYWSGIMSALRWVMGEDRDFLDT